MIERRATFADQRQHRLRLERIWRSDRPTVICCGKNPADADENRDDLTTLRMIGFCERWGFGRLVMVNVDTFVTASPLICAEMVEDLARCAAYEAYGERCILTILDAWDEAGDGALFIAGWGQPVRHHVKRHMATHKAPLDAGIPLHHLGLTSYGWPKHPLARGLHRIPDDQQPIRWTP